ncbi:LysR family transcriptional regulator [Nakamurella antarctica]|uniref:LysR family transcriptional regulator n=1 Tax=Nakamurella antarctica TaxID=1902245 RepID=A0A3G8ZPM4_9ACTN|nr:LysR family transcriptional regulator [Nakamurella antarctica]AZI59179.1 LysR family transcriptional regulator [Nakamurella antarctica]
MTIELRHLRAFLAIAQEGTVTAAAAALHMTQPAVSRTLIQLEAQVGLSLVDRSTHHLHLTPAGERFQARAAAAVAAFEDATDPERWGTWPLRLGYAWSALGNATPVLLRGWARTNPDIPLELLRCDERTAGLAAGSVDAALIRGDPTYQDLTYRDPTYQDLTYRDLTRELLMMERRIAAVPSESYLAAAESVTLEDLARETVAINPASGSTTLDLWPPQSPPATITVANTDDWLSAIASGRAVGVTAAATGELHRYPGVTYLPLRGAPDLPVYFATKNPPTHPAVDALLAMMKTVLSQHTSPAHPDPAENS